MNILAIDYGTKNIGLARASSGIDLVLPFGIINNDNNALPALAKIITTERIGVILIGLPTRLDGSENNNTIKIRNFTEELKKQVAAPVIFISEVFSSQAADRMGQGVSRDEKSAMIILDSYLQTQKFQQ